MVSATLKEMETRTLDRGVGARFVLVVSVCLTTFLIHSQAKFIDPCAEITPVKRGGRFNVGIIMVPRMDAVSLVSLAGNFTGGLCNKEYARQLTQNYSAVIATYELRVDRLHVLKQPFPDVIFNMKFNETPATMVLAAFRANITSPAIYIASGEGNVTQGAGFMVSAALLLRFNKGVLSYMQWYDQTCNECGGKKANGLCLQNPQAKINACSTPLTNCSCVVDGTLNTTCSFSDPQFAVCATALNVAWLGDDSAQAAFRTGPQVQRLNAYSIVSLFFTAKDKFNQIKNLVYENIAASWGDVSSSASSQLVDFEGGLTSYNGPSGSGGSSSPPSSNSTNSTSGANATSPSPSPSPTPVPVPPDTSTGDTTATPSPAASVVVLVAPTSPVSETTTPSDTTTTPTDTASSGTPADNTVASEAVPSDTTAAAPPPPDAPAGTAH